MHRRIRLFCRIYFCFLSSLDTSENCIVNYEVFTLKTVSTSRQAYKSTSVPVLTCLRALNAVERTLFDPATNHSIVAVAVGADVRFPRITMLEHYELSTD